ncbi:hypothetical protein B6N60_04858 [Richelia sinica FACHB-800]|uniref:Uncharacterized protein n=1 Tax=Richelia sinica FACHB-800 TaxID=1357546 RepID=A0A975Y7B2_9NOST|nr:hypothetical protein B6N60_04858 [Richelia sinica FACHB-800]
MISSHLNNGRAIQLVQTNKKIFDPILDHEFPVYQQLLGMKLR